MPIVAAQTQKIIVNPATTSVTVIPAGPIGPTGLTGPPDAGGVLTVDGQIMTRAGGALAPITRDNLAQDTAFTSRAINPSVLTADGQLLTRVGGVVVPITRAALAADPAFYPMMPAGTVVDYMGTIAPDGWIILAGQTITNGQTLYPEWWAVLPAAMKSGADIICPDTRGRVTVGHNSGDGSFDAIGETGGAKTHTLTTGEMPTHAHVHDAHNHTQNAHTHTDSGHTHLHQAGGGFTVYEAGGGGGAGYFLRPGTEMPNALNTGSGAFLTQSSNVGVQNATATNVSTTSTEQNAGGGGAHNNLQPYIVFSKMVRAY